MMTKKKWAGPITINYACTTDNNLLISRTSILTFGNPMTLYFNKGKR